MSSMGGQIGVAGFSAYSATKFALEGLSESLAAEVSPFGIRVLIVEPGAFRTSFSGGGLLESEPMDAYAETVGATREMIKGMDGQQPGDPAKAAEAILAALAAEEAPLRLPLGADAVDGILQHGEGVLDELRAWEPTARDTAFADTPADPRKSPTSLDLLLSARDAAGADRTISSDVGDDVASGSGRGSGQATPA